MKKNKKRKTAAEMQKSKERKENAKLIAKTLYSNDAVIDCARRNPWWSAIIMFLLSIFIPIIPILTQGFTTRGSSFLDTRSFGYDTTLTSFLLDMEKDGLDLKVDENYKLNDVDDKWEAKYGYEIEANKPQYAYINKKTGQYDLLVYYAEYDEKNIIAKNDAISKQQFEKGTITIKPSEALRKEGEASEETKKEYYTPNYLILTRDLLILQTYKPGTVQLLGEPIIGDYKHFEPNTSILSLLTVEGVNAEDKDINNQKFTEGVFTNVRLNLDTAFITRRDQSTMTMSLVSLAIFAGLGFFMGLMIFLLTRGKRNMYSKLLNFGTCQEIQAWNMLTPGILGMIFGYILPNQGSLMFFIIFLGIRVMWMSMKQLKPQMR